MQPDPNDYPDPIVKLLAQAVARDIPMETLLGVDRKALRRELRDSALRKARELMPGPSTWMRNRQLASAILRFESRGMRGDIGDLLARASMFGKLPVTPEGLHKVLR